MCAMKIFRPYNPEQLFLLPPALRDWLPEGHLALFLSDVVDELDLSPIFSTYEEGDGRGQPPFHPAMMVKLLLYAYCMGKPSSRKIERVTYEEIPYRVLAANQHPDHDSLAEFRKRHLKALASLFQQVLKLCQAAGLVKLGHVALDGSKIKANASKHKAMSYERMSEAEQKLEQEVAQLLAHAQAVDASEDRQYGPGRRGDELPAELAQRETRLKKIRQAKRALEQEAQARAEQQAEAARARIAERQRQEQQTGQKAKGPSPQVPDPEQACPEPKAQRNFTDPDSRIMKDGATKSFAQAYNAQAVVTEGPAQIIVAWGVTQAAADAEQFVPMVEQVTANTGQPPAAVLADAGYFSERNLTAPSLAGMALYVPPDRQTHGGRATGRSRSPIAEQMRATLRSAEGHAV